MTVEEFERDSEAGVERSEVTGEGGAKEITRMQMLEMEVDDGEDKVVVEKSRVSGGRKWAPSSPPKLLRKRACA